MDVCFGAGSKGAVKTAMASRNLARGWGVKGTLRATCSIPHILRWIRSQKVAGSPPATSPLSCLLDAVDTTALRCRSRSTRTQNRNAHTASGTPPVLPCFQTETPSAPSLPVHSDFCIPDQYFEIAPRRSRPSVLLCRMIFEGSSAQLLRPSLLDPACFERE